MFTGTLQPIDNQSDWIDTASITDADTGALIDLTDMTEFVAIIRDLEKPRCERATAKLTTGGVVVTEPGIVQWTFSEDTMNAICAGTYQFVARITKDATVTDLLICSLTVVDG